MQGFSRRQRPRVHVPRFYLCLKLRGLPGLALRIAGYATDGLPQSGNAPMDGAVRNSALPQHGDLCNEHLMHSDTQLHSTQSVMGTNHSRKPVLPQEERSPEQQVKDSYTIGSICRIIESQGWGPNTETLLNPFAPDLSQHVVANVVLRQENISMAMNFFRWSGHTLQHTPHVYHALLIKFGEAKLFDKMWHLLHEMREKGSSASGTSLSIFIKAYGLAGMPQQALETLNRACEFDIALDAHVYTSILGVLFKARMVSEADSICNRMMQEKCPFDASVWSTLIRGLSRNGMTAEAERCWQAMLKSGCKPALIHYNAYIEGLCESNGLSKALLMLNALKEKSLKPNAYTFNPILAALCEAKRFSEAFDMFWEMENVCAHNQATFNMLLEGLFLDTDISKAVKLYDWLEDRGCVDSRGYFLLAAGLRKAKQVDKLMSVSENLHAKHGVVNIWLCNSLLHCLCERSDVSQAASYFNRMLSGLTNPDVVSFATMINGYCKLHMIDEARRLFSTMTVKPNAFCYGPLISALLKAGKAIDGLSLFKDMLSKGLAPNSVTCDFLLRKLGDAGVVDECIWLLTYVQSQSLQLQWSTLDSLMVCLNKGGEPQKNKELYEALKKQECLVRAKTV